MYVASNSLPRQGDPRRAVAVAEFALLLPMLVLLSLATIDVFRLFHGYITLADCARNGAVYASSSSDLKTVSPYYVTSDADFTAGTRRAVKAGGGSLNPALVDGNIDIQYATAYAGTYGSSRPTVTSSSDGYVKVTVTWTYTTTINYALVPQTWPMSRSVTMRIIPN